IRNAGTQPRRKERECNRNQSRRPSESHNVTAKTCQEHPEWGELLETDWDTCPDFERNGEELSEELLRRTEELFEHTKGLYEAHRKNKEAHMDEPLWESLKQLRSQSFDWARLSREEAALLRWRWQRDTEWIYAAPLERLSSKWWDADSEFEGPDCMWAEGFRSFTRHLAEGCEVRFGCRAVEVKETAEAVEVRCEDEALRGDLCIVSLPLGVLKARGPGAVRFSPALAPRKVEAVEKVGLGLLNKVALRFEAAFWPEDIAGFDRVPPRELTETEGEIEAHEWVFLPRSVGSVAVAYFCCDMARDMTVAQASIWWPARYVGCDTDAAQLAACRENHRYLSAEVETHVANACSLPLPDHSVEKLMTAPPWDRQFAAAGGLEALYPRLLAEFGRVLTPTGRMALLLNSAAFEVLRPLAVHWRLAWRRWRLTRHTEAVLLAAARGGGGELAPGFDAPRSAWSRLRAEERPRLRPFSAARGEKALRRLCKELAIGESVPGSSWLSKRAAIARRPTAISGRSPQKLAPSATRATGALPDLALERHAVGARQGSWGKGPEFPHPPRQSLLVEPTQTVFSKKVGWEVRSRATAPEAIEKWYSSRPWRGVPFATLGATLGRRPEEAELPEPRSFGHLTRTSSAPLNLAEMCRVARVAHTQHRAQQALAIRP
ncbi:unnamed protein product, partial [Effrenium voratum]